MALSPLPPGTNLAQDASGAYRYRVNREIGSGGFGVTYDAEHLGLGRRVVIKELACDSVSRRDVDSRRVLALTNREGIQQRVQRRFVEEARLLSRLAGENCPHIVRVIDVFEENGTAYYVMDRIETSGHVPSEPLRGPEGVRRALRLGRELLVALEVAHRYTALHGDIKPANLLLDSQDRLVLIDFGTARSDEDLARTRATTMHTPGYAPPELMSAPQLREAGAWSDLYSWAMVVYGLLWRHPWQVEDESGSMVAWPLDVVARLRAAKDPYADAAYASLCGRGVPASLAYAIYSCLSLTPSARPQRVRQVIEAFDAVSPVGGGSQSAVHSGRPTSVSERPDTTVEGAHSAVAGAAPLRPSAGLTVFRHHALPEPDSSLVRGYTPTVPTDAAPFGFVHIPPGSFLMGSPQNEPGRREDELQHYVTLTRGFYLQSRPVTQRDWQKIMKNNPSFFVDPSGDHPVEGISWLDAVAYANALSRAEGLDPCYDRWGNTVVGQSLFDCTGYRLPTEAEWEYAARAGTTESRYGDVSQVAWCQDNSGRRTRAVGQLTPNAWGLYDMLGNVQEWTHDWYAPYASVDTNPCGPPSGFHRVLRGGSWYSGPENARAASRDFDEPSYGDRSKGFRLARSAP